MTADLSWMVQDIVDNVPQARHAVVLSAVGIPKGAAGDLTKAAIGEISAAMSGMQSLSHAIARFAGPAAQWRWNQTIIEFSHGWVFLVGAGQGAYLAAAAGPDVDLQQISFRMHRLVARLGGNLTSAPRVNAAERPSLGGGRPVGEQTGGPGLVLPELDKVITEIPGAHHVVLLGANGLSLGSSSRVGKDLADMTAAAMSGLTAYSRATAQFARACGNTEWLQTVIEYQHGWVFLIAAGNGAYLAASAEHDCDIAEFTLRLQEAAPELNAAGPEAGAVGDA